MGTIQEALRALSRNTKMVSRKPLRKLTSLKEENEEEKKELEDKKDTVIIPEPWNDVLVPADVEGNDDYQASKFDEKYKHVCWVKVKNGIFANQPACEGELVEVDGEYQYVAGIVYPGAHVWAYTYKQFINSLYEDDKISDDEDVDAEVVDDNDSEVDDEFLSDEPTVEPVVKPEDDKDDEVTADDEVAEDCKDDEVVECDEDCKCGEDCECDEVSECDKVVDNHEVVDDAEHVEDDEVVEEDLSKVTESKAARFDRKKLLEERRNSIKNRQIRSSRLNEVLNRYK